MLGRGVVEYNPPTRVLDPSAQEIGIVMLIRVVSLRERPVGRELTARFGEAGGTIGRGETSTLVLPDPERHISRTHATIAFQASGFVITDNGTKNSTILNGRPMGPGMQARLADGDQIKIGEYTLEVSFAALGASQMPRTGAGPEGVRLAPKDDPLAMFGNPWSKAPDPFADLLKPVEPPAGRPDSGVPDPAISPFAKPPRPDPVADLQGREPSIDDVLGGLRPSGSDPLGAGSQPGRVFLPPDALDELDPLVALGGVKKPVPPPTISDHDQELVSHYAPPMARLEPVVEPKAEPSPPPPAARPSAPPPPAEPAIRPASVASDPVETGSLLRALLAGAGIPEADQPKTLTPETMEAVGSLLREAVHGTLDLLRARGLMKSEMRADVTMIMPIDNNPLKFSPSVEAALVHLLTPHVRGFMPPLRAMKDAYDDLRAHQLGFLAGMRAALDEVLRRFAPEELGRRLSDPTVLDSLLPMNRKAKQWDLFVEKYGEIVAEAREDFNAAFGKAFLRAYEAQIKRLRAEGSQIKSGG